MLNTQTGTTLMQHIPPNTTTNADVMAFLGFGFFLVCIGLTIYLFPTIIAMFRGHPKKGMIFLVNAVAGASGIGWMVCLFWAAGAIDEQHHHHYHDDDED